jgi:hypothetical protein
MDKLGKGTQPFIRPYIEDLGLASPLTDILLPTVNYQTHYSGIDRNPSQIDHVFHSSSPPPGFSCTEVGIVDDAFLDDFHHHPVWVGFKLPQGMHTARRGKRYTRPLLYTIRLKGNEVQLEAYNLLVKEFRDKNPIPTDSIDEIPGLLAAAHLETIKAVKDISGNAKRRIHE